MYIGDFCCKWVKYSSYSVGLMCSVGGWRCCCSHMCELAFVSMALILCYVNKNWSPKQYLYSGGKLFYIYIWFQYIWGLYIPVVFAMCDTMSWYCMAQWLKVDHFVPSQRPVQFDTVTPQLENGGENVDTGY